jgi:hypothetical protein
MKLGCAMLFFDDTNDDTDDYPLELMMMIDADDGNGVKGQTQNV